MCGIAGFLNLDRSPADAFVLRAMTDLLHHRGPDDQGLRLLSLSGKTSAEVGGGQPPGGGFEGGLGFNRLKILDLSERGHQPMVNADGTVILAFNGEIYNAFDFKPELEAAGYQFRSRTDTEVILHLYERYGLDGMLNRLNGMFAIVIADLRTSEIHVAIDHFGIKPMYWALAGNSVLFASEAKAFLRHPAFSAEIDGDRVDEYLGFRYVAGGDSLMKGVQQLRPGWCLRITPEGVTTRRYWELPELSRAAISDGEAMETLEDLLRTSVKSQLLSDVPVGCQLSGGVDSSIVSVFARKHFDAAMETFSIVFDDQRHSEEKWMVQAATAANATNHRFTLTPDYFIDTIAKASWHMDQPMGHPNSVGISLLAERAHDSVTVLLSGEGADEVFAGYTRFYYANLRPRVVPWMPLLRHLPRVGPRLSRQFGGDAAGDFIQASLFHRPAEIENLRPGADFEAVMVRRHDLFAEGGGDHLSNCLRYEMQTYMVDLLVRQDKMTMAHSVENRVPFLDRNLVEFSRRLPTRLLASDSVALTDVRMRGTKVILKRLAAKILGDEFAYRPKSGFSLPLSRFFRTSRFTQLMEDQLLPGMRARGLVDASVVRSRWKGLVEDDQGGAESVWISAALELWAQQFVDAGAARTRALPTQVNSVTASPPVLAAGSSNQLSPPKRLSVVFCWAEVTGYMAACWQALSRRPDIDVHVVHTTKLFKHRTRFDLEPLMNGLSNQQFATDAPGLDDWLLEHVISKKPDVVVVCGWIFWPYTRLMRAKALEHVTMVLGMDSPWRGTWLQRLAYLRLGAVADAADLAVIAGERSAEYARRIGVPPDRIRSGYYGFDYDRFMPVAATRPSQPGQWPRQFLFVGRYVEQKDLSTLVAAYSLYRGAVANPWGLTCSGAGVQAAILQGVTGIVDRGFTQPADQPSLFRDHGAFVLSSKFEPWGVVLAEAAASGLPLVCTTACGAGVDLVRPYFNGLVVPPGDVDRLARAMRWIHDHEDQLPVMGLRGQALAEGFSADAWATRWHNYMLDAIEHPR